MPDNETPTTGAAIQKLAQQQYKNRRKDSVQYKTGTPTDKVWDNYQLTKELKRQFKSLCKEKKINASSFLRSCVKALIKADGDLTKLSLKQKKVNNVKSGEKSE